MNSVPDKNGGLVCPIDAYAVRRAMQEFPAEHQTAGLLVTLKAAISTYLACLTSAPSAIAPTDSVVVPRQFLKDLADLYECHIHWGKNVERLRELAGASTDGSAA